jgi:hypothetical protein
VNQDRRSGAVLPPAAGGPSDTATTATIVTAAVSTEDEDEDNDGDEVDLLA